MKIRSVLAVLTLVSLSCTVYVNQAPPTQASAGKVSPAQSPSGRATSNKPTTTKASKPAKPARRLLVVPEGPTEQFVAAAPTGMGIHELGRPFDAKFQRLPGSAGASLFPNAGENFVINEQSMEHHFERIDTAWELAAHARAWGFTISANAAKSTSHASYQAVQIARIYELNDGTAMRSAPKEAVWYPWRVYVGRMYEIRIEGESKKMGASLEANLLTYAGGISAYADEHGLKIDARGRGLVPTDPKAIFADTPEEIEQRYDQASDDAPAVIMVVWRSIPGRVQAPKPQRAGCRAWAFDKLEWTVGARKSGGGSWDADDSAPDVSVTISVDGTKVRTTPKRESTSISLPIDPALTVTVGSRVKLDAIDIDLAEHDQIGTFEEEVPGSLVDGQLGFGSGAATLSGRCVER